uniref:Uncharacterized protein n=1 Tax=Romanomermis culicivorax TaxID=13658 RepID=A0A915JME5_ROMCU
MQHCRAKVPADVACPRLLDLNLNKDGIETKLTRQVEISTLIKPQKDNVARPSNLNDRQSLFKLRLGIYQPGMTKLHR